MKLLRTFRSLVGRGASQEELTEMGRNIVAHDLRNGLKQCPACEGDFVDHYYARFAMTAANSLKTEEFVTALREHDWRKALEVRMDDRFEDLLIAAALRCPGRQVASILMLSPYDPYSSISVLEFEVLNDETGRTLLALTQSHDWVPLFP